MKKNKKKNKTIIKLKTWFKKKSLKKYTFKQTLLVMILSMIIGILISIVVMFLIMKTTSIFTIRDFNKLFKTYATVKDNYYGKIDKQKIVDGSVSGMLSSLGDDYTDYMSTDNSSSFMETVTGKYNGIGCTISTNKDGQNYIVSVFDNSPSSKAGLKVGDIIKKVDGKDYSNKSISEISSYIKTHNSKTIILNIIRDNKEKTIKLKTDTVEIPTVTSEVKEVNNKKIGYIDISIFSSITEKQFLEHLTKLEKKKITGLVIDVRDNSGGYLSTVTDIANRILKKNQTIYQIKTNNKTKKIKSTSKKHLDYPIAIIQNKNSASASEILSSAIKESYKGYVVGVNSYGKGTVQETLTFSDTSIIKYTTEKWLTPKGNWINEKGVEPTDYIELSTESDNQLEKALELVSK